MSPALEMQEHPGEEKPCQADVAGCFLRWTGHDFMDFRTMGRRNTVNGACQRQNFHLLRVGVDWTQNRVKKDLLYSFRQRAPQAEIRDFSGHLKGADLDFLALILVLKRNPVRQMGLLCTGTLLESL